MPLCQCLFPKILWMWLFFTCLMSQQKKREVRGTEGGNVCHFKGNETTTHILFTFRCPSCVTVHHMAVNKIRCLNLQYKHLYVCVIQYLQCIHQGSGNIFLSVFTFRHIVYFSLQNKFFSLLTYTGTQAFLFSVVLYMLFSVVLYIHMTPRNKKHSLRSSGALFRATS